MLIWGQFSGLSRASHLACAHFSPVRVHPDGHASVSQGGFRRQGFWGVGRTSSGLASPSSFVLPRLKASSAHASGWEIPLTTRTRKLWSLCLSPNQGPMLLLVSCLEASAGDQLQLLSPGPVYLPHHHDTSSKDQECWGKLVSYSPKNPTLCSEGFGWIPKGREIPARIGGCSAHSSLWKIFPWKEGRGVDFMILGPPS